MGATFSILIDIVLCVKIMYLTYQIYILCRPIDHRIEAKYQPRVW